MVRSGTSIEAGEVGIDQEISTLLPSEERKREGERVKAQGTRGRQPERTSPHTPTAGPSAPWALSAPSDLGGKSQLPAGDPPRGAADFAAIPLWQRVSSRHQATTAFADGSLQGSPGGWLRLRSSADRL